MRTKLEMLKVVQQLAFIMADHSYVQGRSDKDGSSLKAYESEVNFCEAIEELRKALSE